MESDSHSNSIDALLPQEMAENAEQIGVDKTRLEITRLLALAVLAGAFIGFGSLFSIVVTTGAEGALPYGVTRLLGGLVFSLYGNRFVEIPAAFVIVGGEHASAGKRIAAHGHSSAIRTSVHEGFGLRDRNISAQFLAPSCTAASQGRSS